MGQMAIGIGRRQFITFLCGGSLAWPHVALAQNPAKRPLVAVLATGSLASASRLVSGFPQGMRELGYVEGTDVDFEYRYADGDYARFPALAEELVRFKPDVIVASNPASTLAVKRATATIPIVAVTLTDPVGLGLAASYARPGGQVTGILSNLDSLPGKLLEILREVVPGAVRIGVLINMNDPSDTAQWRDAEAAAAALPVKLVPVEVRAAADIDAAFQLLQREHVDAVSVLRDGMFLNERQRIAALAAAARLPAVYSFREHVEAGGLICYGVNLRENWRRTAYYVDRILKGAKPGDLPIELPNKMELVINRKTAKALGLTVSQTLLATADELIE
jgi:putative tryptophan/tyrosine transport system substrate-binding protein